MKCPHCAVGISLEEDHTESWTAKDYKESKAGYNIGYGHCPECEGFIVKINFGRYEHLNHRGTLSSIVSEELIYPKFSARTVEAEVPERYKKDFLEAASVLPLSPKASAALSRRIVQDILREKFKIKHANLANEIEEFINLKDVPSFLSQAVDAVRNVGNFAAHPSKNTNTGEVVEVEPGEAEWLLEVVEALFDFSFVQPIRLEKKKNSLNQRLYAMGKPPMKSKT